MHWQVSFLGSFLTFFTIYSLPAQSGGDLVVEVAGIKNGQGQIGVTVFASAEGFPGDNEKALYRVLAPARTGSVFVTFPKVPPGNYAISAIHDENDNARLDTNLFGIPKEGWGVSNDARARFGPPKFEEAAFRFEPGGKPLRITLRY